MSHHTMLRRGRRAAAATVIAVAALALTACQGNSPKPDPAGSPSPVSSAGSSGSSGADSGPGAGSAASGGQGSGTKSGGGSQSGKNGSGTGGSGGSSASQTSSRHGASARCTTGGLQAGWSSSGGGVPDMHSDAQQNVTVWLKNSGRAACTISGFPGVQLKANDGHSIDLPRSSKKPTPVTLKPGASASFTITFLPSVSAGDRKIAPGTVLVTPPNEKQHLQLKWPYGGAILDQSGATHPGTYVNPVTAG
ncbi:DUF4232 domain-containing protein [Streptomyces sp. N2A]|uniref:DUF4232 domain-containing protein n=1 Tax=Streptomyces sp. N2A TaxID=3073936 RepID=UPI0028707992|nr:DUF4232 domain-containing protein [Streptomyces sp. N2A]